MLAIIVIGLAGDSVKPCRAWNVLALGDIAWSMRARTPTVSEAAMVWSAALLSNPEPMPAD